MKLPRIDTSSSDFRQLRETGCYLVDKSLFLRDLVDAEKSIVIPRPRRFGKTTNLEMAREFFRIDKQDQRQLFAGMKILDDEEACAHMGKYPVIFLDLKSWQPSSLADLQERMALSMSLLIGEHRASLASADEEIRAVLDRVRLKQSSLDDLQKSLFLLCKALQLHHGAAPVLLIDEYDAPIHRAYAKGFYVEAIDLLRPWISDAFKTNPHLFRGVLTGILRISRESLFSGLNNIEAYTLLSSSDRFQDKFGFTEDEVARLLADFGKPEQLEACRKWYNGYIFGKFRAIYNPWSVTHFAKDPNSRLVPHWVNTSGNSLIWDQLSLADERVRREMMDIIAGGSVRKQVTEATQLFQLPQSEALWSLMVLSGYLKAGDARTDEDGTTTYQLEVPNLEVSCVFRDFVRETFSRAKVSYEDLPFAMLAQDRIPELQKSLRSYFKGCASYFDGAKTPETFIHGLFFGICAHLRRDFLIASNPETGEGRADLLMIPRKPASGLSAKVLEFKVADEDESLEAALDRAFKQIESRDYAAKLREAQCAKVLKLAIAVKGKDCLIDCRLT